MPTPETIRSLSHALQQAGFDGVAVTRDRYGACLLEGDVTTADEELRVLRLAFASGLEIVRNGLFRPRAEFAVVPTRLKCVYCARRGDTFASLALRFYGSVVYERLVASANLHLDAPHEGAFIDLPI